MGNKESYALLQQAVLTKDFDEIRKYIADDFVMYEPPALPYGGVIRGAEGFVNLTQDIRKSYSVEVVSQEINEAGPNILLCEFVFAFTSLRTGETTTEPVVDIFRFDDDGKIVRADIYYSDAAALAATA